MNWRPITNYLKTIPDLEKGGCLIAVDAVYRYLKKENKLPEDFQIVGLYNLMCIPDWCITNNLEYSKGKRDTPDVATHFVWKTGGKIYDSNGIFNPKKLFESIYGDVFPFWKDVYEKVEIPADKTEDFLVKLETNPNWNPTFDRKKYVPLIEEKFGIKLEGV